MKPILFLFFVGALQLCAGEKILSIVPIPSKSHHFILERLMIELAKKGHEVTLVTPFKLSKPVKNLKEVIVPDLYDKMLDMMKPAGSNESMNVFKSRKMSKWLMPLMGPLIGPKFSEMLLSTDQVQDMIKNNEKFDLVICETFFVESIIAGFAAKSKAPIVAIAGFMPNLFANFVVGNPAPASYIPDTLLGHSNRMNFWERLENTVFGFITEALFRTVYIWRQDSMMRQYFGDDLPPLDDIMKNTSLVLVNHHFSLAFPRPYLPNMVEIGGYHINPPKPLPTDLQKYFDESKEGVILFSMGSHIKSKDMPQEVKQEILKAFSRLKQDIIWKFEDDTLTDVPKNVKILKWVPQSDILAHPNLKLFITHGGLLSTTEAVTRGVPLIGIPVTGDQPINMKYTTEAGFGLTLELDELNERNLYEAIVEVLNNPKYMENAKRGSALMQDRPLSPIDTALYWIEYVLRHKGAPHLKSAAQDLAWYQLYLLDVLGFILIVSSLFIFISFHSTKFIVKRISKLFCKKKSQASKEKKRN